MQMKELLKCYEQYLNPLLTPARLSAYSLSTPCLLLLNPLLTAAQFGHHI